MNVLLGFEILRHFEVGWQEESWIDHKEKIAQNHEDIVEIMMKLVQILLPNFKKQNK